MNDDPNPTPASREYDIAYAAQYTTRDLLVAIHLYQKLVEFHPDSVEAGYSRKQIQNIVTATVPRAELLDAQCRLALLHLNSETSHNQM